MTGERRHDTASERIIIGAAVVDARTLDGPLAAVAPADFHHPAHESLWGVVTGLHQEGKPTDVAAVAAALAREPVRGITATDVVKMTTETLVSTCGWHGGRVRDLARVRRVQEAADRIASVAATGDLVDVDALVEEARSTLDEASADRAVGGLRWFEDALAASIGRWSTPDIDVLPTRWAELDDALNGGLRPGHLMVVGARPAVGKSLVATVLVRNVAQRGAGALFAALEMSEGEVVDRIVSAAAGIQASNLTKRSLTDMEWRRLESFTDRNGGWPVVIDDRPHQSVAQIAAQARSMSRTKHGLALVVVDYLQLVRPADPRAPRHEQVGMVARTLKLLAKDLRVPIVALAQVNRAAAQTGDGRPRMSDLRESGDIETSADEIVLLHRDGDETAELEMNVVKNRHGRTGRVTLEWAPQVSDIRNVDWRAAS